MYITVVEQARRPEFYQRLRVPDTLDGRFDLVVLHAFLLLYRLGREGQAAKHLSQALFDLMFADMDGSLRELGVSDLGVGRRVKAMAKAFYGRVAAYEPGLSDASVLADALHRNLYRGAEKDSAILEAMARYVRAESENLLSQPFDKIGSGHVRFGDPIMP